MIFSVADRQSTFDDIQTITKECDKIISLVQVGSGAVGYHDEKSDLDFVIALDSNDSMLEVMDHMHSRITEKYDVCFFAQNVSSHMQVYFLSNMLEIDIGFGAYEYAAARKPAFKVLYDRSGVVEEKMIKSREWMDDSIYSEKQKNDITSACNTVWSHMMHAAVAIKRGSFFRAVGEMEFVRKQYIDLLADRYRFESAMNREIDRLPEEEKTAIKSTLIYDESEEALWTALLNLTKLTYKELEGAAVPVTQEMMCEYYKDIRE